MQNWAHQDRGKAAIYSEREAGITRLMAFAPCGAGKSRVMRQLAMEEVARGGNVRIYLHRSALLDQMINQFTEEGIEFGVMAAGKPTNTDAAIQLCMIDSVYSRALVRSSWDLGTPTLVIFDEAHNQVANKARSIVFGGTGPSGATWNGHEKDGAFTIGFSATPVGCGDFYEKVVEFGNYKEMRQVKAHLPVRVYSPSEMDLAGVKRNAAREFQQDLLSERSYTIFGDAYTSWKKLNPDARPSILFAPSVPASRWFAQAFCNNGVKVAHIDGETILFPTVDAITGRVTLDPYENTTENREELMAASKSGEIAMVSNRFVLREAIDMPWLYHGILATAFGSIASYLQSVGRIQRFCPGMTYKVLQDHGGNYWRHGSPNDDRHWDINCTESSMEKQRLEAQEKADSVDRTEICCPNCSGWRLGGAHCPHCGHKHAESVRRVRTVNGELKLMRGIVNGKKKKATADPNKIWTSTVFGSIKSGRSVSSAVALWKKRCKDAGVVASVGDLRNPPPAFGTTEYHLPVGEVFEWAKR